MESMCIKPEVEKLKVEKHKVEKHKVEKLKVEKHEVEKHEVEKRSLSITTRALSRMSIDEATAIFAGAFEGFGEFEVHASYDPNNTYVFFTVTFEDTTDAAQPLIKRLTEYQENKRKNIKNKEVIIRINEKRYLVLYLSEPPRPAKPKYVLEL